MSIFFNRSKACVHYQKKKKKKSFVIIREIERKKKKKNSREERKIHTGVEEYLRIFSFSFFFCFPLFLLSFTFVRVQDEIAIYRGVGRGRRSSKQFCQALKYKRVGLLLSRMMALNIHFAPGPLCITSRLLLCLRNFYP